MSEQKNIKDLALKELLSLYSEMKEEETRIKELVEAINQEVKNRMEDNGLEKIEAEGIGKFTKSISKRKVYFEEINNKLKEIKKDADNNGLYEINETVSLRFTKEK